MEKITNEQLFEISNNSAKAMVEAMGDIELSAGDFMSAMTLACVIIIRTVSRKCGVSQDEVIDLFCENTKKYKGLEKEMKGHVGTELGKICETISFDKPNA